MLSYFNYNTELKKYLKHNFKNSELLITNYSQLQQDMFVLSVLDGKQNGTFIDIGAHHPIIVNNTYLLESVFGWKGLSIELDPSFVDMFKKTRNTPCICEDATKTNYKELFNEYDIVGEIDYLSVDIEPPDNTFFALKSILETDCRPTVITFEHEAMNGAPLGVKIREDSRKLLLELGYTLMVKDVSNLGISTHDFGTPYNVEDWWVLKDKIREEIFNKLCSNTKDYIESKNTVYNVKI